MARCELEIVSIWSHPQDNAYFTQRGQIGVQVRNTSERHIELEKVECLFNNEEGLASYIPAQELLLTLAPGELSCPIFVNFEFDLALRAATNRYAIKIRYAIGNVLEYDSRNYIVIHPLCPPKSKFFISHKDPADTLISRKLSGFLSKLGLVGYLAEDDRRLGLDLWDGKIIPTIAESIGTIILFTSRAKDDPAQIVREIEISKDKGKPLILVLEPTVEKPINFPNGIEYYRLDTEISADELKKLAWWIYDTYRKGRYNLGRNP